MTWRSHAACKDTPVDTFFPERAEGVDTAGAVREAKLICSSCPVREECLKEALEHREEFGVFGGMTAKERDRERRRSRGFIRISPPKCGTDSGYTAHRRRDEEACQACRMAHAQTMALYKEARAS